MAKNHARRLLINYLVWKLLLLVSIFISPGPGYDTSTSILFQRSSLGEGSLDPDETSPSSVGRLLGRLVHRLIRWDAFYFTQNARHGYGLEQQWAFGWGFAKLAGALTTARTAGSTYQDHALTSVLINLSCHLASVFLLYRISVDLCGDSPRGRRIAFLAANLHIITPAGVFMCAPYGESMFSALSFAGSLLYIWGIRTAGWRNDGFLVLAGLIFGTASTVRGNGILAGVMFAADLALELPYVATDVGRARRCGALVCGGGLVGLGFALPQSLAYLQFCTNGAQRPWCSNLPPSIYTFVQSHYWNVGFLRYWTVSNIPLFVIAMPMLVLMFVSSVRYLRLPARVGESERGGRQKERQKEAKEDASVGLTQSDVWRFALHQLILTLLALCNFHVQIITRISTGYFLYYIWLAGILTDGKGMELMGRRINVPKLSAKWAVMYAMIQGGLFASFLPPA